jgi:pimeloyl-ACP methyl ester carboxylesterase
MAPPAYFKHGSGKTFLYIPGLEGTGKLLYKQLEDLSRDHTVLSMPLRAEGPYRLDRLVEDAIWVTEQNDSSDITVLAESFGGLVAIATALARPDLFRRMILLNTFPWFRQRSKIRAGVALFSLLPYSLFKVYRARRSRDELFSDDISSEDRRIFHELTRVVPRDAYLSRLRIIRDTDFRSRLGDVQVQTLIVAGTHDALFDSVEYGRQLSSRIPRARLKILRGTGHVALLSGKVQVRDWLTEFEGF